MSVCCECCVLSGKGVCDGLITRPEESYRLWCVSNVCDHETSTKRGGPGPYRAVEPYKKKMDISVIKMWYLYTTAFNVYHIINCKPRTFPINGNSVHFSRLYNLIDKFPELTYLLLTILKSTLSRIDLLISLVSRDSCDVKTIQNKTST
jgi:hypothetical protein